MKTRALLFLAMVLPAAPSAAAPGFPEGWSGGSHWTRDYDYGTEAVAGANGQAAYIKAKPEAAHNGFSSITQCIRADNYRGARLRFSGRLKTAGAGGGQLWMRIIHGNNVVSLDNMYDRRLKGTSDWQRRDIVLNVPQSATRICFGFLLAGGEGEVWADDLSLTPVGFSVPTTALIGSNAWPLSRGGMDRIDH